MSYEIFWTRFEVQQFIHATAALLNAEAFRMAGAVPFG